MRYVPFITTLGKKYHTHTHTHPHTRTHCNLFALKRWSVLGWFIKLSCIKYTPLLPGSALCTFVPVGPFLRGFLRWIKSCAYVSIKWINDKWHFYSTVKNAKLTCKDSLSGAWLPLGWTNKNKLLSCPLWIRFKSLNPQLKILLMGLHTSVNQSNLQCIEL